MRSISVTIVTPRLSQESSPGSTNRGPRVLILASRIQDMPLRAQTFQAPSTSLLCAHQSLLQHHVVARHAYEICLRLVYLVRATSWAIPAQRKLFWNSFKP